MSHRPLSTLRLQSQLIFKLEGAGYETVGDLLNKTPESLSQALNIPLAASQQVFSAARPPAALPMTQSMAAMMGSGERYSTGCAPLDKLLDGGLRRGFVLEINGPPGSGKEQIAVNAIKSFVEANHRVLFVDMQNMAPPATITRSLTSPTGPPDGLDLVHYLTLHSPLEFVIFLRNLSGYLDAQPSTALLVLDSLAFPFQTFTDFKGRAALQEKLKETLTRLCASKSLSVIITSQLVNEPRRHDPAGQSGSAPAPAAPFVMHPCFDCKANGCCTNTQKTKTHAHFPTDRTYRVLIVPQWKSGVIRLLLSPRTAHVHDPKKAREEAYQRIGGTIQ